MFSDTPSSSSNNNNSSNSSSCSNNSSNNSKSYLCNFGYLDYIVLASTLAIALAEELSEDDLEILSTFFAILADELDLISSIQECNSGNDDEDIFVPPLPGGSDSRCSLHKKKKIRRTVKKRIKKK